jgi:hypothetical protein
VSHGVEEADEASGMKPKKKSLKRRFGPKGQTEDEIIGD